MACYLANPKGSRWRVRHLNLNASYWNIIVCLDTWDISIDILKRWPASGASMRITRGQQISVTHILAICSIIGEIFHTGHTDHLPDWQIRGPLLHYGPVPVRGPVFGDHCTKWPTHTPSKSFSTITGKYCRGLLDFAWNFIHGKQKSTTTKTKKPFPFLMNFNLITPAHQISNPKEMLSLILMSVSIQFSLLLNSVFTRVKYISSPVSSQQEKLVMRLNLQTAGWESRLKIDSLFNPKCLQKVIFQLCSCWSDWLVFITAAPAHKWNLLKGAPSPLIN